MYQILVFGIFLGVAMPMQSENSVLGRLYHKPGCNGIAFTNT
jgi:hypothetical protein